MFRAVRGGAILACLRMTAVPISHKRLDEDRISHPIVRDPDSGFDRVFKIFDRDNNGTMSPEACFVSMFTFTGGWIGAVYGGLMESRIANLNYRESSEATLYYSNKAAMRELLDKTTIGFGKGAARWGFRYAFFCFSFAGLSTVFSRYRGEFSSLDFSVSGLITGALYRFSLGPKGMISGGFFGSIIGTMGGFLIYALSKLTGVTMNNVYEATQIYFKTKDKNFHGAERHVSEPDIILECIHPYGTVIENTLDHLEDIHDFSELRFNKNRLPKNHAITNENVKTSTEKK